MGKVDADWEQGLTYELGVRSLPTIIAVVKGYTHYINPLNSLENEFNIQVHYLKNRSLNLQVL